MREKGRYLTQSYDKSPYNHRKIQQATWQHKKHHQKLLITQRLRTGLGRSVGVTKVTPLVWLNRFRSALWVIFLITSTSGFIMYQICHQFLHMFSRSISVIYFFLQKYSVLCMLEVYKRFLRKLKNKRQYLTFLYSVSYKSYSFKFWELACMLISTSDEINSYYVANGWYSNVSCAYYVLFTNTCYR